ncbi:YihY/virulence factor BrkB family protein [Bailinhaonella thermotolerans]|uniref:YihY/virulence factor BrkB family protein n=1 Tax=Bailinhaonella thermotolerans TaxID=1070861 RepID=UPI001F5B34CA|nr:YihY/virulence factor BrkB family protein [Bailinhaonella thermotolerans]
MLRRTVREFREDSLPDWSAALTYYAVLSVFPALLVLVSLLGLFGGDLITPMLDNLRGIAPGPVHEMLRTGLTSVQRSSAQSAGLVAVVSLLVALWSASGYVAAFIRASNAIYDIEEGRPFWKLTPLRVGLTLLLVVLMAVSAAAVALTGRLAGLAGEVAGIGTGVVAVWNVVKWPVLALLAAGMIMILYWAAPNVRQPGWRWLTPGGLLAVVLWVVVSAGFAIYVANFGSYNKTYGALATVVVFLVWLWLSNMVILLGAELDAELERGRRIEEGLPPAAEPYAEPRDTRKMESTDGLDES